MAPARLLCQTGSETNRDEDLTRSRYVFWLNVRKCVENRLDCEMTSDDTADVVVVAAIHG